MNTIMLFASDCPLAEIPYPPGFAANFDTDYGAADGGGLDDGFAIFPLEKENLPGLQTEKKYLVGLGWRHMPDRAGRIAEYLEAHLKIADEIELWFLRQDADTDHQVQKVKMPVNALSLDEVQTLCWLEVQKEPIMDYCFTITRANAD